MFLLFTADSIPLFRSFVLLRPCAKTVGYTYMRNVYETRVRANTRMGVRRLLALWWQLASINVNPLPNMCILFMCIVFFSIFMNK